MVRVKVRVRGGARVRVRVKGWSHDFSLEKKLGLGCGPLNITYSKLGLFFKKNFFSKKKLGLGLRGGPKKVTPLV